MGGGTFDSGAYRDFSSSTRGKSTDDIYSSRTLQKELDPMGVKFRESRDSADSPKSTPLILALDVTGSMGIIADQIAREGLGVLINSILERQPISNPHVMFMGIGDARWDRAPLQVSQFEADNRIVQQLTQIWLEHGGGNNDSESYNLAWHFAGFHTVHDSMEKRGKRGYLFTVGDECAPEALTVDQIKAITGADLQQELSARETLEIAQRLYHVYHVIIEQGSYCKQYPDRVFKSWSDLLGQNVIRLADYTKLAETIVSAIEVAEGREADTAARAWGDVHTQAIVHQAIKQLPRGGATPMLGA